MTIRDDFILSLNVDELRIKNFPGFIFLFGGHAHVTTLDHGQRPASMRGIVYDMLCARRSDLFRVVQMPEKFQDWLADSAYPNLLDFEIDLAELASLIVIIVESSGAIAELGAFSTEKKTKEKILVVSNDNFISDTSFIEFGIYRYLERVNVNSVNKFEWGFSIPKVVSMPPMLSTDIETSQLSAELICNSIGEAYKESHKVSPKFDRSSDAHWMLLIADLIQKMHALTIGEIKLFLEVHGKTYAESRLKQLVFILIKLEFIRKKKVGSTWYYVADAQADSGYIKYSYSERVIGEIDLSIVLLESYRADDKYRFGAIGAR